MNVYVFGMVGFIGGFLLGQWLIAYLLRDKTKEELLKDQSIRDYGLIPWGFAIGFCVLLIFLAKAINATTP